MHKRFEHNVIASHSALKTDKKHKRNTSRFNRWHETYIHTSVWRTNKSRRVRDEKKCSEI